MPVPEIDRLAHEILDILGDDPLHAHRPDLSRPAVDRAAIAIDREFGQIYPASKPFTSSILQELQARYLYLQHLPAVGDHAPSELDCRPVSALLRLYAALERAEMQERATPTPNLDADQKTALPLRGLPDDDMSRHQEGEGTR